MNSAEGENKTWLKSSRFVAESWGGGGYCSSRLSVFWLPPEDGSSAIPTAELEADEGMFIWPF